MWDSRSMLSSSPLCRDSFIGSGSRWPHTLPQLFLRRVHQLSQSGKHQGGLVYSDIGKKGEASSLRELHYLTSRSHCLLLSMAAPTPQQRVFDKPEFLEPILINLRHDDIPGLQRVARRWRGAVIVSPAI